MTSPKRHNKKSPNKHFNPPCHSLNIRLCQPISPSQYHSQIQCSFQNLYPVPQLPKPTLNLVVKWPWLCNVQWSLLSSPTHPLTEEGLQNMQKLIDNQLAELNTQDQTQSNNIKLLLPSLHAKGLVIHITDTLGWPDLVGEPPFS